MPHSLSSQRERGLPPCPPSRQTTSSRNPISSASSPRSSNTAELPQLRRQKISTEIRSLKSSIIVRAKQRRLTTSRAVVPRQDSGNATINPPPVERYLGRADGILQIGIFPRYPPFRLVASPQSRCIFPVKTADTCPRPNRRHCLQ